MKEQRTIELKREDVLEILAKHYGVEYRWSEYGRKDGEKLGDERTDVTIFWEGSEEKVESKGEKIGMRSKEEIMKEVRGYKEGRDYAQLEVLINIRDNIDFLARVGR